SIKVLKKKLDGSPHPSVQLSQQRHGHQVSQTLRANFAKYGYVDAIASRQLHIRGYRCQDHRAFQIPIFHDPMNTDTPRLGPATSVNEPHANSGAIPRVERADCCLEKRSE